jgi:glucan phosphoethanolaminetransferase (alkaline phosphatase superfamily)
LDRRRSRGAARLRPARTPPASPSSDLGIVLIVMYACRADKFSCYGFERETTPRIDALAREPDSTIFRRHYVQSNWTNRRLRQVPGWRRLFVSAWPVGGGRRC